MRCPQCSAEQPGGVTVCGFCGAPMVGGSALAGGWSGAARADEEPLRWRRWASLMALALAVGMAAGWLLRTVPREDGHGEGEGAVTNRPESLLAEPRADGGARTEAGERPVGNEPTVVRGQRGERMTVERLEAFAEELAELAADGRADVLATVVDPRARYRLTMQDPAGRRELDGGKAELLAHWLAPWLVAERFGGLIDEIIEVQNTALDADPRQGILVRRLEAGGDATRIDFPRRFLLPLATRGALAPNETAALDLSPLVDSNARCVSTETVRVAATPMGLRVIAVERIGLCEP